MTQRQFLCTPLSAAMSIAFTVMSGQVQSQQATPNEVQLAPVVSAVSLREQEVRTAPASITVITREQIEARNETSVTELLRSVEGVSIVGSNPNDTDILLRGMPGDYTLLLVDGKRQNTRETMNRGTGGVQANLLPPLAAIERIEVVRGPMSSIYGADAMGGVVNIVTRKLPQKWGGAVTLGAVVNPHEEIGGSKGAEFWLGGPIAGEALGLQLWGGTNRREEDDVYYPLNATAGANGQRDERIAARLTARLTPSQQLSLDLGHQDFEYLSTPGLSNADAVTATTVTRTTHGRDNWGLTHEGTWSFGRSTVAFYGEQGTQTQYNPGGVSTVEPEIDNTTFEARLVMPWAADTNTLTIGTQGIRQTLKGVARQDAVPAGLPVNPDKLERDTWAVFGENDFAIGPDFTLTAGLRMDSDEKYGDHFSPRLYGVYELGSSWQVRGGVGTGFKAPTLRQSSEGYCMTTGGAAGANPGTLCGNPELEPETSISAEAGVRWDRQNDSFSLTYFDSRIKNRVASYDTGVTDPRTTGRTIYVYDNITRVDISGFELAAAHAVNATWRLAGNYTFTDSKRRGSGETAFDGSSLDGKPLDKTPKHKANLRLEWQATPAINAYAAVDYIGKQYWAAFRNGALNQREREATTTLDLGGRWALNDTMDFKLALINVTDRRVDVDPRARAAGLDGNWMVDEGRRLSFQLAAQF